MTPIVLPDPATIETMPPDSASGGGVPRHVTKRLLGGTSALGASVAFERGAGFLANILAARLGGATTFGAYSLAITTANQISTYAAGGIGATAARFSGKYPFGTPAYRTLGQVLTIVSVVSAALAALGLWLGAAPIAHLMHRDNLTGLLRWAALSAVGIILLECARGFFVGQRQLVALLLLSGLVGAGMICVIPFAAKMHSPVRMVVSQGLVTTSAVVICLLLGRRLGLFSAVASTGGAIGPMLREVWSFGFIQLAGLIGANLAGWWLTTLVARADTTLVQMSFLAIANQLRNIVALAPSLLTESSYAVMAESESGNSNTPPQIMALCTYGSTFASLLLACAGMVAMPWVLNLLYGRAYGTAAVTTAIALAVAVVHMGNAPAAARLSIVSIRAAGIINTVWAFFVATAGTLFMLHRGSAREAMVIYLAAHLLAAAMVLIVLHRKDFLPRGMVTVFLVGSSIAITLAYLAFLRDKFPGYSSAVTALMFLLAVGSMLVLYFLGRKRGWFPSPAAIRRITVAGRSRLHGLVRRRGLRRSHDA